MLLDCNLLQITKKDDVLVCDSRDIAMHLGISHKNLLETIRKYETETNQYFSTVAFKTLASKMPDGRINPSPTTYALLTEVQATFIVTLSRNTPKVVEFKATLVQSFYKARLALQGLSLPTVKQQGLQPVSIERALESALISQVKDIPLDSLENVERVLDVHQKFISLVEAFEAFKK